jgi:hypothetical protein
VRTWQQARVLVAHAQGRGCGVTRGQEDHAFGGVALECRQYDARPQRRAELQDAGVQPEICRRACREGLLSRQSRQRPIEGVTRRP